MNDLFRPSKPASQSRGELPFSGSTELPASPWFHTLADPSRPLGDDAPVSGGRELPSAARDPR